MRCSGWRSQVIIAIRGRKVYRANILRGPKILSKTIGQQHVQSDLCSRLLIKEIGSETRCEKRASQLVVSQQLLIELSSDQHASDLLGACSDSVESRIPQYSTNRVVWTCKSAFINPLLRCGVLTIYISIPAKTLHCF